MKKKLTTITSIILAASILGSCSNIEALLKRAPSQKFVSKIIYSGYTNPAKYDQLENTIYGLEYDDQGRIIKCTKSKNNKKSVVTYEYEDDDRQPSTVIDDNGTNIITTNLEYDKLGFVEEYEVITEKHTKTETENFECDLSYKRYDDDNLKSITNDCDDSFKSYSVKFDEDGQIIRFDTSLSDYEFEYENGVKTTEYISHEFNGREEVYEFDFEYKDGFLSEISKIRFLDDEEKGRIDYTVEYELDETNYPKVITIYDDDDNLYCKYQITYIDMDKDVTPNYSDYRHQSMFTKLPGYIFDSTRDFFTTYPMGDVFSGF